MRWLLFALFSGLVFIYGLYIDSTALRLLTKGLPVIALIFWLRSAPQGVYRRWISIGLLFSLGGDILLDIPEAQLANQFVFGLGSFLIGHLAYVVAYTSDTRRAAPMALLIALACGGSMFWVLNSKPLSWLSVRLPLRIRLLVPALRAVKPLAEAVSARVAVVPAEMVSLSTSAMCKPTVGSSST